MVYALSGSLLFQQYTIYDQSSTRLFQGPRAQVAHDGAKPGGRQAFRSCSAADMTNGGGEAVVGEVERGEKICQGVRCPATQQS